MSENIVGFMICTRQRPKMVEKCLFSILTQIALVDDQDFVVLIENDAQSLCQDVVQRLQQRFPCISIFYVQEPEIGIPLARQTGLEFTAARGANWGAFIDDDEELEDGWLFAMKQAIRDFQSEVFTGPVRYLYDQAPPKWMGAVNFKNRPRGVKLLTAATNNTLLNIGWYVKHKNQLRFDPAFRFTGGSDTDFFYRLTDLGGRITWIDDAIVSEAVPVERSTVSWQLQRARRTAANAAQIARKRKGLLYALRRYGLKSLGRIIRGSFVMLLFYATLARHDRVGFRGKKALASSMGYWDGMFGTPPEPYLDVTGS